MNTNIFKYALKLFCAFTLMLSHLNSNAQEAESTKQDSSKTKFSFNDLILPNPSSVVSKYVYDPISDRYIYTEKIGEFNINNPLVLTPEAYQKLVALEQQKSYYKDKIDAFEGKKEGSEELRKNLIPDFYVNSDFFSSIFGGDSISIRPQGSVDLDLGALYTQQDNPSISPRNRQNVSFDFDQRIQLSLLGQIGTRLRVTADFNTEASFNFQNLFKLEYTPTEDDIIKKIEVGNVNLPINSSLITGAQSLFGVKTELQFGKTSVSAVFSEQRSEARTVTVQGGGTVEEFEFFGLDYDENRHYFLAQYFRNNYNQALTTYPYLLTQVQITRIELWITNRGNQTNNIRNIVAFQDLGESTVLGSNVTSFNPDPNAFPNNENNAFNPLNIGGANSQLTESIRDIARTQQSILTSGTSEGIDYSRLENARQLQEGTDFTLHTQLGYVSLNQRLQNDEVLAVAFQYTVGDQVFQVGEFANDGVDATETETIEGATGQDTQIINNQALVLKTLKSSIVDVEQPLWDLMMKNIYNTGAFDLSQEDFRLNIFYTDPSPLNFITPVEGTTFPVNSNLDEQTLLNVFNLDKLNFNNDPQTGGDGFFDFVDGVTVIQRNGKIIFTTVEPFGKHLFDKLALGGENYEDQASYNPNQQKYVYDKLYSSTKIVALEDGGKNKFQIKGRYKSEGISGIPIGFNVPRGSVTVTAGGRTLIEGQDYTVNYQFGTVQILDPTLQNSNVPIEITTEDSAVFGQQTKRFTGVNVQHQFNKNFVLGGTVINLRERPITQKANFNSEPINNTILGINGNFSTEVPFLTRWVNKLPNIDTDAVSNISARGEFAYLLPGSPAGIDFNGEATSYIDDFEGAQNAIDMLSPLAWTLSSRPRELGRTYAEGDEDDNGVQNGFDRAHLNWYTIDPIFYNNQRPSGFTDDDVSSLFTHRVFIDELFPNQDVVRGQTTVINTLDLAYYPSERGAYNMDPNAANDILANPRNSWAGITRQITSTNFEQSNVEFIEFWVLDPFSENRSNPGGKLVFNLGNISEDVLKDGRKQYENGLPEDGDITNLVPTDWGTVVPQEQSLVYAFASEGQQRTNQDVGLDGFNDAQEASQFPDFSASTDPAKDNYAFYLNGDGDIFERYKNYNGLQGNTPDQFSNTNRGATTQPDVEDVNRDNTLNTIDSYFEYEVDITPSNLNLTNPLVNDVRTVDVTLPNGVTETARWYQFRVPLSAPTKTIGGITDLRSIRFMRMYLNQFTQNTVFRFGTLDLIRSDWRRYTLPLDDEADIINDNTIFNVSNLGIQDNASIYVSPPGITREEVNNNNTIVRLDEQALVLETERLESKDSRAVFKNISVDMRRYERLRMFLHAEAKEGSVLNEGEAVGFIRMGNDLNDNFYQIEVPLSLSTSGSLDPLEVWKPENEINITLDILAQIKALGVSQGTLTAENPTFYNIVDGVLDPTPVDEFSVHNLGQQRVGIKGNPSFGDIRTLMVGIKNARENKSIDAQVWYNELRLAEIDNKGGWAAVAGVDLNIADFMTINATANKSTTGFGSVEQGPNERSLEDTQEYNVTTNIQLGQLLPKKWGITIPLNYEVGETVITPEYDQQFNDLKLEDRLNFAADDNERDKIRKQSEDYTKRKSINFIGVKKNKTGDSKPRFYDIENFTFNYSFNEINHRDFEIESSSDQTVRAGVNYNFSFKPLKVEPFKKNDSLFSSKYLKLLKDFNLNLLPTSLSVNSDFNRQFNRQKFRNTDLSAQDIGLDELFRRNYVFDFNYTLNWNITDALSLNYNVTNNNIVRNYFVNDNLQGEQDASLDVWDGFFDIGDPNRQFQSITANYKLPIDKIPHLDFLNASVNYQGDYQWQKTSDGFNNLPVDGEIFDLGNTVQNSNSIGITGGLEFSKLYKSLGLVKKRKSKQNAPKTSDKNAKTKKTNAKKASNKGFNTLVSALTFLKRLQFNYRETNGTFIPGFLDTPDFITNTSPTLGFIFGSQRDIRQDLARRGLLTDFEQFNQQYRQNQTRTFTYNGSIEFGRNLKIDITGGRNYTSTINENFNVTRNTFNSLNVNQVGNFDISTILIKTAFSKSDENESKAFTAFRDNRLIIARRLASDAGIDLTDPNNFENNDTSLFPLGYGNTNQAVLIPAFLSAYTGQNAEKTNTRVFKDVPLPNWNLRYSGLTKLKWFKKRFKRLSLSHGYSSLYTVNQFNTDLEFSTGAVDQNGNFRNPILYSNINLVERFSPLLKVDMELKNSLKVNAEIRKDRTLSLSLDNGLLTELQTNQYTLGLGYRFKDVKIRSQFASAATKVIKSDLDMSLDISVADNLTIIRYLDLIDNQVTAGQTIWSANYNAQYAFSKNFTGIFFVDYSFSKFAISTAFPQTTARAGFTFRYNFGN